MVTIHFPSTDKGKRMIKFNWFILLLTLSIQAFGSEQTEENSIEEEMINETIEANNRIYEMKEEMKRRYEKIKNKGSEAEG